MRFWVERPWTVAECESEGLALSYFALSLPVLPLGEHLEPV